MQFWPRLEMARSFVLSELQSFLFVGQNRLEMGAGRLARGLEISGEDGLSQGRSMARLCLVKRETESQQQRLSSLGGTSQLSQIHSRKNRSALRRKSPVVECCEHLPEWNSQSDVVVVQGTGGSQ